MAFRHLMVAVVVVASFSPLAVHEVRAQEGTPIPVLAQLQKPMSLLAVVPAVPLQSTAAESGQISVPIQPVTPPPARSRSYGMLAFYASTVALQALDTHSTLTTLNHGAVEANPIMGGITSNRLVFVAAKAVVATGTILAARKIAKRNKAAAVAMLVAVNSAYAFVVVHNYKVASAKR